MRFYLGTHKPHWLGLVDVPLFVSHRRLDDRRSLPRARTTWALDSGSFSEVGLHGSFITTPAAYVAAVRRYADEIGGLEWAAPQDHMCEPFVLRKSRLANDVAGAQRWTIDNYRTLRELAPDLPIIPVLQGWRLDDYRRHLDAYLAAGVDLEQQPRVGLGSVCRRQATTEIAELIAELSTGLRLHAFGAKISGLARYGWCLTSADSMAWSFDGRRLRRPCPEGAGRHGCGNCLHYALTWRARIVDHDQPAPVQLALGVR